MAQGKDLEKATKLYDEAKATLNWLLPFDLPSSLKRVKDEEALFDHLLTVYGGRFTGTKLLDLIRENTELAGNSGRTTSSTHA